MTATVLRAQGAGFRYPHRARTAGPFDLEVGAGELHLVGGVSGVGKSTLARMLSGAIPHLYSGQLTGRVTINGRDSAETPLWQIADTVGLVSQNPASQLFASSVRHEIAFGLENQGLSRTEVEARLEVALATFGLDELGDRDPRTLSGGEQQKVALAAVTCRRPQALVVDEPFSMLDPDATRTIARHLDRLRRDRTAVVVFEHRDGVLQGITDLKRHSLPSAAVEDVAVPRLTADVPSFRVEVEQLRTDLGGREILRGIDLRLAGGEAVAVVGPNGAGKTTLLRALAGLQASRGRISIKTGSGVSVGHLGVCFQNPDRQIFNSTVREEITFGCPQSEQSYRPILRLLGLEPYADFPPLLLSEGEKKRLAIAILLARPGLWGVCLDEPTLGQDPGNRRRLGRIVRRLTESGRLCIVATHDLDWATRWCDRVLSLRGGRIVGDLHTHSPTGKAQPTVADECVEAS